MTPDEMREKARTIQRYQPTVCDAAEAEMLWEALADLAEDQKRDRDYFQGLVDHLLDERNKLADRVEALEKKVTGIYERIENYLTIETENEDVY